jgi:hypothetical protein
VSQNISDQQLYDILSEIVIGINDMHVSLYTSWGDACWQGWEHGSYPDNKLINPSGYFDKDLTRDQVFEYQELADYKIGYIKIRTFMVSRATGVPDDRYLVIDQILEQSKTKDGIIIEVRANGRGNSNKTDLVAVRFWGY